MASSSLLSILTKTFSSTSTESVTLLLKAPSRASKKEALVSISSGSSPSKCSSKNFRIEIFWYNCAISSCIFDKSSLPVNFSTLCAILISSDSSFFFITKQN